jgi:uncharacterized protein
MIEVTHDIPGKRFVAQFPEGKGELTYERVGTGTMDFQHTRVDGSLRGRGVADALVRAAMDYARSEGFKVIATCAYTQKWLERHPDQRDIVVIKDSAV